ncbi:DUF4190 domain-containing protein [Streptomyces minutiscleroticus]|uniref:DUF4190 domain-containing protein n=1 Tax=Streptomyces minutiscleroticus TaxID=68238 RepID=UPI000A7A019E
MDRPQPPGPDQPQPSGPDHTQGPYAPPGPPQGPYGPPAGYPGGPVPPGGFPQVPGPGPGPVPGPGPYAAYPYQSWGQGYSPYNRPAPVNGLAITALVLGALCCLPLFGLAFGIAALVQIRKRGERGKGMAIAGMVLSGVGTVLLALALVTGVARAFWEGVEEGARGGSAHSLDAGDCFVTPGGLEGMAYDIDEVPCAGEHDGEVFATFTLPAGAYPGDDEVTEAADGKCYPLRHAYVMDSWTVPSDVDVYYLTPTRDSWRFGDREVTCLFGNVDEKGTLTGSLRRDDADLTADQLTYLRAEHILDEALESAPAEAYAEDDLAGHQEWAGDVSTALTRQAEMLRAHDWSADADGPVDARLEDLDAARKKWEAAAGATDADAFYEHYDEGMRFLDADSAVTARKALGLAATPPAYGDGPGGTGESPGGSGEDTGKEV